MLLDPGQEAAGKRDASRPATGAGQHDLSARYDAYASQLFDFCCGVLADRAAAVAAAREALDSAVTQPGERPTGEQLRVRLFARAHQACASAAVRPVKEGTRGQAEFHGVRAPGAPQNGRDGQDIVAKVVGELDPADREVLMLAFRCSFTREELAQILGLPVRWAARLLNDASARFNWLAVAYAAELAGCPALGDTGAGDEGPVTQSRARLARHASSCPDCTVLREDLGITLQELGRIPLRTAPAELRGPAVPTPGRPLPSQDQDQGRTAAAPPVPPEGRRGPAGAPAPDTSIWAKPAAATRPPPPAIPVPADRTTPDHPAGDERRAAEGDRPDRGALGRGAADDAADSVTAAGPAVAGPAVAGPAVAGPVVPGPAVAGPAVAGPVVPGPAVPGPAGAGPADGDGPTASTAAIRLTDPEPAARAAGALSRPPAEPAPGPPGPGAGPRQQHESPRAGAGLTGLFPWAGAGLDEAVSTAAGRGAGGFAARPQTRRRVLFAALAFSGVLVLLLGIGALYKLTGSSAAPHHGRARPAASASHAPSPSASQPASSPARSHQRRSPAAATSPGFSPPAGAPVPRPQPSASSAAPRPRRSSHSSPHPSHSPSPTLTPTSSPTPSPSPTGTQSTPPG